MILLMYLFAALWIFSVSDRLGTDFGETSIKTAGLTKPDRLFRILK